MKKCKCGNTHDGIFGSGKFCSRACANSRGPRSKETISKIKRSIKKSDYFKNKKYENGILKRNGNKERIIKLKKTWIDKLLTVNWDELTYWKKKKRIKIEQNNTCLICKNSEWLGKPITLEIDHADGNKKTTAGLI